MYIQGIDTTKRAFTAQERRRIRWHYYGLKGTLMLAKKTIDIISKHCMSTDESKLRAYDAWEALDALDKAMETRVHLPHAKEY